MRNYILRRLLILIPIMLGVSFLTFAMFRMIPGDAAVLRCQLGCTPEVVKDLRHQTGLDRPWYRQYSDWLWNIVRHGDLGESLTESKLPVTTELNRRLPITVELLVMTLIMALLLGIPPGVISAIRPGTPLDWLTRFGSVLWLSIPSFWLGILVIAFGVRWFDWTPPQFGSGYVPFLDDPWVNMQQFFFPSLVLALAIAAVIIEAVFNLNGVGKYVLEAILRRDFFVVQSLVLLFAAAYVMANLVVDVLYGWLDPRIRYG